MEYLSGFGNEFASEALKGALPEGQNSPQKPPFGLYPEQLSGTAFTLPVRENLRSWLYRIRPSVLHSEFKHQSSHLWKTSPWNTPADPNQMRWNAFSFPEKKTHFIQGITTLVGNGNASAGIGCGIHVYSTNQSMEDCYFYNSDGDMMIVPQEGDLTFVTEFGILQVKPGEICVIQRGIKFRVELKGKKARGYICENYGAPFRLPDRGPIGANGLANARDFLTPIAHYEDKETDCELWTKYQGELWKCNLDHSPCDVVAWHGNYAPYKYDLEKFNTIASVSYDHTDPSIFTVLTSPSSDKGIANIDFVIFPKRWMVAEHTFRPPYYHRNIMSEFMGLIYGQYDAKEDGFVPGGASLHNCMAAHGPEATVFEKATKAELKPQLYDHTMAFMWESRYPFAPTPFALECPQRQKNYLKCWQGLKSHFKK